MVYYFACRGGLAGDALFVAIARRVSGPAVLRVSAIAAGLLYPAFLLVPSLPAKVVILAALSVATVSHGAVAAEPPPVSPAQLAGNTLSAVAFVPRTAGMSGGGELARIMAAPSMSEGYGWTDLTVAEAEAKGDRAAKLKSEHHWLLATDFRPHSHHFQALAAARKSRSGAGTIQREQHRHRMHRRREVTVLAVQRLGRHVGGHRLPVSRERQRGHPLPGGFEGRTETLRKCPLAGAVDALDGDQHGASLSRADPIDAAQ